MSENNTSVFNMAPTIIVSRRHSHVHRHKLIELPACQGWVILVYLIALFPPINRTSD